MPPSLQRSSNSHRSIDHLLNRPSTDLQAPHHSFVGLFACCKKRKVVIEDEETVGLGLAAESVTPLSQAVDTVEEALKAGNADVETTLNLDEEPNPEDLEVKLRVCEWTGVVERGRGQQWRVGGG
jgi:hypothetical protein